MQLKAIQCTLIRFQFYEMHFNANQIIFNRQGYVLIEINLY
jgi:hypothetical protein